MHCFEKVDRKYFKNNFREDFGGLFVKNMEEMKPRIEEFEELIELV